MSQAHRSRRSRAVPGTHTRSGARAARKVRLAAWLAVLSLAISACERDTGGMRDGGSAADDRTTGDAGDTGVKGGPSRPVAAVPLDDFGEPLPVDATHATRVVSLNPTFTEIVFAIGAGDRLVGRTQWDTRPDAALEVTDVGPGIRPNVEAVLATRPTLVLLYATAENRAAADALRQAGVRTLALRTVTIADFNRAAIVLGTALGRPEAAATLADTVAATLARVRDAVRGAPRPRVVWPSWESPVLVVGNASYEAELLEIAGADNVFADREESVANVTLEEIAKRDPDLLLAGPDRLARLALSPTWRVVRAVREKRMIALDTLVVGRPGVHIGMAAVSIARALHPDIALPQ